MDLLLAALFCYQLHRMAREKGISPWPFVLNYLGIFFMTIFALIICITSVFGVNIFQGEQQVKTLMSVAPFTILFEVFLFIYFRKRIQKTTPGGDNNNDYTPPSPPTKEKKDLSYFR